MKAKHRPRGWPPSVMINFVNRDRGLMTIARLLQGAIRLWIWLPSDAAKKMQAMITFFMLPSSPQDQVMRLTSLASAYFPSATGKLLTTSFPALLMTSMIGFGGVIVTNGNLGRHGPVG
jgi:hypothetical protein